MPRSHDPRYRTLLSMNDTGEQPNDAAILVAPIGTGTYVYTTLALFRQLGIRGMLRLSHCQLLLLIVQIIRQVLFKSRSIPCHRNIHHQVAILFVRQKLHVGECLFENLVSAPVVPMPMRVDDVDHWLIRKLANFGENGLACGGRATSVEHDDALVGNNRDRVSTEPDIAVGSGSEEIHAIRNFGLCNFPVIGAPATGGEGTNASDGLHSLKLHSGLNGCHSALPSESVKFSGSSELQSFIAH